MNVVHVDTERTWRGGEQQIAYLSAGLDARGHRTTLIAPPDSEIHRRFAEEGRAVEPVRMRGELDPAAILGIAGVLRRVRPDVVHMHTAHAHMLGVLASRLAGVGRRVVSRRVDFPVRGVSAWLKYRRGVDRFIAITDAVARVLREGGVPASRIDVVPSGIDPARLDGADRARGRRALGVAEDLPIVGTVAHFAWHKGLVHLVEAWPRILERAPGARLVLVGHGEDEPMLRAAVVARGVESSVHFAGFRTDVPDCLAAFDCFVLPSVLEGLGTSLLDALALERPVVASRTGGIPEVILHERTGLLVMPGDAEALAAAVVRLLARPEEARAMARAGRRLVRRRFTAESMVEGTLESYRSVVRPATATTR